MALAFDRPGWGLSESPEDYRRTSIFEQATIALAEAGQHDLDRFDLIGVGFGAVVGLEAALAEPARVGSAALVEPPLLGLLPDATAGVSADVEEIAGAVRSGDEADAYELFLSGGLPSLGAGADRLGSRADRGPQAPHSFLVEVPAVPGWPLDRSRFDRIEADLTVVTVASTPTVLEQVAECFISWLGNGGLEAGRLVLEEPDLARAVASLPGSLPE